MAQYLLGIDIGTSGCKIALFSLYGAVVCEEKEDYSVYYPKPGYVEQDPEDWWLAVCRGTKRLIEKNNIDNKEIIGIGIDGQSWSAIAVDNAGKVLFRNPIWMDTRSQAICEQLNKEIREQEIFNLTGNLLKPQYTTGKILWYKQKIPDVYQKTDKILQSNSFIVFRMTGAITHDISQGYGIHCFDMKKSAWDLGMAKSLGLELQMLPELVGCHEIVGKVTSEAAEKTGLLTGTPVAAGGLDAACGTLGVGVIADGQTQEQGGQAGGMSICTETCCAVPDLIMGSHVVPGKWLLQGGTTGGGGAIRWFDEQFKFEENSMNCEMKKSSLDLLNAACETIAPGSDGVIFLPYMAGERSPIWDEQAKGVFFGLDYSKTKAHMARAVFEGVAFSLKHNLNVAEEAGIKVKSLRAMGGSANSVLWTQIKSDVTQKPIEVPSSDTATTLGAAILAGVGVGAYKSFEEAVEKTVKVKRRHQPDASLKAVYKKNYDTYLQLYPSLKQIMHK